MRAALATTSLALTVVSLLALPFFPLFAPFLFALFVLALAGVLAGLPDRKVAWRDPVLDGRRWRNGS
ncbi:MAG TPA: hypothetical protein VHK22_01980 [Gaiellaceae bacterium]|jgi:hypothetical protein|nr:hypothetical protein [Gaiellaceae bacterium]